MGDTPQVTAPPDLQKTLADPEFLKLGPDDQVAVLKHLTDSGATPSPATAPPPAATAGGLPPPPSANPLPGDDKVSQTFQKLTRGATLGAASGLGIPESTDPWEVVSGGAKSLLGAPFTLGAALLHDMYTGGVAVDPQTGKIKANSDVANIVHGVGKGLWDAGTEGWQGAKEDDPEKFAHGFGSFITQALLLKSATKMGGVVDAAKVNERVRLAKVAKAIDAGGPQIADLKTAMPEIVATAGQAGMSSVGEMLDTVSKAKAQVDQTFNQALAPVANKPYIPTEIAQRIRALITPDMAKTADGRMAAKEINAAARDYDGKSWTINELNAKRMTENENLRQYYNKDTRGQAASKLQVDISKAVADGARDIVYDQISQANPGLDARTLKLKQGALWAIEDHLKDRVAELEAKQLQHEGESAAEKLTAGASVGRSGVPHGYVGGLAKMFSQGPQAVADAKIAESGRPSLTQRASRTFALSLPIDALVGKSRQGGLPPPPSASQSSQPSQ